MWYDRESRDFRNEARLPRNCKRRALPEAMRSSSQSRKAARRKDRKQETCHLFFSRAGRGARKRATR